VVEPAVWLCPGQGAQRVGMAKDVAERFPAARETLEAIDEALAFPLSRVMFEGPEGALTATHTAQPAILAHSAAVFAVVAQAVGPVAATGHSLGEYSAYVTAGALEPVQGAALARARGTLMHEAGAARPGAMAAVIGVDQATVDAACQETTRHDGVVVPANLNAPDQTVISGDAAAVASAGARCEAQGARVMPLKVSGAFHSPLMSAALPGLRRELERVPFATPRFPVVANATAEPVTTASRARELLETQLTAPVRWVECVREAARLGGPTVRFVEIGPGGVLARLVRRILPDAVVTSLGTADDVARFLDAA
jgi:[acyl-carrier-protein] S-malonyltransferase